VNPLAPDPLPDHLHPAALRLSWLAHERDVHVCLSSITSAPVLRQAIVALLATDPRCRQTDRRSAYRLTDPASHPV